MLIDKMLCVGVGQCGGNFVQELEKVGFNSFYINSSLDDLDLISTNNKHKYHINGKNGMAKNRNMAVECLLENDTVSLICDTVIEQYSMSSIIFMFYSLAGGTGGGMGNIISARMKELYPDKTINVVCIAPKKTDDIGMLVNTINALEELEGLLSDKLITQCHLLSNDTRENVFDINKEFSMIFDSFINFNEIDTTGNLDDSEREQLLSTNGMGVILEFANEDFGNGLLEATETSIYSKWNKDPSCYGLILNKPHNKEINKQLIKDVLGVPMFTHSSVWNEESNILYSSGMNFNESIINDLKQGIQVLMDKKKEIEEENKKERESEKENANVNIDINAITSKINQRNTQSTISQSSTPRNRRRKGESASAILDSVLNKYRNIK